MCVVASTLADLEPGSHLEVRCERCGRAFGTYELDLEGACAVLYLEDRAVARALRREDARGGVRGPLTGRRRAIVQHGPDGLPRLRWRCGCGRDVYRRTDRMGGLPVTWSAARGRWVLLV
jgi:hypothetical protein